MRNLRQLTVQVLCLLFVALLTTVKAQPVNQPTARAQAEKQSPRQPRPALRVQMSEAEIQEARTRLGEMGYWVDLDAKKPDASLYHALVAFQKVEGRARTGALTPDELSALRTAKRPKALDWGYAHIEIDLSRQVLFVVDCCGAILRILPVSSGSGEWFTEGGSTRQAITPTGRFKITRKIAGWRKSPLGRLYYPSYFYDGVAIHGNPSVPVRPASHGCVRIPMFAAREFSEMATLGLVVIVHNGTPLPEPTE